MLDCKGLFLDMRYLFFFLTISILFFSCQVETVKQLSIGDKEEILVLAEESDWNKELKIPLEKIFESPYSGISVQEHSFEMQYTTFAHFEELKMSHNIVIPLIENSRDSISELAREIIKKSNSKSQDHLFFIEDYYAQTQLISIVEAHDWKGFIEKCKKNNSVYQRISQEAAYKAGRVVRLKGSESYSVLNLRFIEVPKTFTKVYEDSITVIFRDKADNIEKNVLIKKIGKVVNQLQDYVELSNEVTGFHFQGHSSEDQMKIEESYPISFNSINKSKFVGHQARGAWTMTRSIMGGPFISYVIQDPISKENYYIQGTVYAPEETKTNCLRELEWIIHTFY